MSLFDEQKTWKKLMNSVDERKREDYIRLNIVLPSNESTIDSIDRMSELRESVPVSQIYQAWIKALYVLQTTCIAQTQICYHRAPKLVSLPYREECPTRLLPLKSMPVYCYTSVSLLYHRKSASSLGSVHLSEF